MAIDNRLSFTQQVARKSGGKKKKICYARNLIKRLSASIHAEQFIKCFLLPIITYNLHVIIIHLDSKNIRSILPLDYHSRQNNKNGH